MLLNNKTAVIYGAGGNLGGAISRAFAKEGARLFLAGHINESLRALATDLEAQASELDVLDEAAVDTHMDSVIATAGSIDVSVNAVSIRGDLQGVPLLDMPWQDVVAPAQVGVTANFITARAAARHMLRQKRGVVLTLSSTSSVLAGRDRVFHHTGGFGVGCAAVEALSRSLAGELGPHGIRVVCLRSDAIPQTWPAEGDAELEKIRAYMEEGTVLGRLPRLDEVASAAVFAASDRAAAMTGSILNLSCGSNMDST